MTSLISKEDKKAGKGSSINDVVNFGGGGIKIQIRRQIEVKNTNMREGGVKNPEKLPTYFMDDP